MQVVLVCKSEPVWAWCTPKNEYAFTFDSSVKGCDGFITDDVGNKIWTELPSNSHLCGHDFWLASDHFAEVVIDPQH
jgi:hypothetical protein